MIYARIISHGEQKQVRAWLSVDDAMRYPDAPRYTWDVGHPSCPKPNAATIYGLTVVWLA